jgi:hypothetical protein
MDLVILYSPETCRVAYHIKSSTSYIIEYPFSYVKNITMVHGVLDSPFEGAAICSSNLVVELTNPPNFLADSSDSKAFYRCNDFTEDQQASTVLIHHLGGHPKILSDQLAKLVSLKSFQNRHNPNILAVPAQSAPIDHCYQSHPNENWYLDEPAIYCDAEARTTQRNVMAKTLLTKYTLGEALR